MQAIRIFTFITIILTMSLILSCSKALKPERAIKQQENTLSGNVKPISNHPEQLATATINSFEKLFGVSNGRRRNHTKGICFNAKLIPYKSNITDYSTSAIFSHSSDVIGRLSHKGGKQHASDQQIGKYGIGLSIKTVKNETHLMALNTEDFFPVATPEAFAELMYAKAAGTDAVKNFKATNMEFQRYSQHEANKEKALRSYEANTYNSINSFYLINDKQEKTAFRWSFVPTKSHEISVEKTDNFFYANIQKNIELSEVAWDMVITLANPDDNINNAAIPWEGAHKTITAAKLKLISVTNEESGSCEAINYDPLVLSSGFAASDDPLLQARRNAYAISFARRLAEKNKQQSKN